MANSQPKKRSLEFAEFQQLDQEIEALLANGYQAHGNWNLSQTLIHIASWMRYPLDGFPQPPIYMRPIFWFIKVTMGKRMLRNIFAEGFSPGVPTAPESVPTPDQQSDQEAAAEFKRIVQRVQDHAGAILPSPFFGPMDKQTLLKLTLLHAAHHLSYLEPNTK